MKSAAHWNGRSWTLIALARRLVDVIWALLRDGRVFAANPPRAEAAGA